MTLLDERSVLGKVQRVLACFDAETTEMSLSDLIGRTSLAKGTAHRVAGDLVEWGVLERSEDGCYRLGLRLFELGQLVPRQRILREAALPFMEDLYAATKRVVHLGVVDGVEVLYLEKLIGHRTADSPSRSGGRMPLHCTAIGKALLAFSPAELIESVLENGLVPRTAYTVANPSLLRSQLQEIRTCGVAFEREESAIGLTCVAGPVFGPSGHLIAAISVAGQVSRTQPTGLVPAVKQTAAALSKALGSNPAVLLSDVG